ncbi:hypothetical protein [Methylobacter sp. BBA5.1]|uniref:hypothetical protein n=1 Tax=Methylobacter sp. BBA5.1 TaxID=1495064 RepID=UPI000563D6D4|nr:hypothetical protein [Methylobacter sp. BBA5.1]
MEHIDTSFDNIFENSNLFPWLPWIGKYFSNSSKRTLILGESLYNWAVKEESRKNIQERINKNDHLRIVHKNNAINFKGKSPYARSIERAIFLKKKPTKSDAELLWTSVAYHNLVLRAMPTNKSRPTYQDYLEGWSVFLNLAEIIGIEQCIVYGLESSKIESFKEALKKREINCKYNKLKTSVGRSYPRTIEIALNGNKVKLLFIRHPSSYFSWKNWGHILRSEIELPHELPQAQG